MIRFKDGKPVEKLDIPDGDYYSVPEYAKLMDVSQGTIRQWIHRGLLNCVSCYGQNYISSKQAVKYKQKWRKYVTVSYRGA